MADIRQQTRPMGENRYLVPEELQGRWREDDRHPPLRQQEVPAVVSVRVELPVQSPLGVGRWRTPAASGGDTRDDQLPRASLRRGDSWLSAATNDDRASAAAPASAAGPNADKGVSCPRSARPSRRATRAKGRTENCRKAEHRGARIFLATQFANRIL